MRQNLAQKTYEVMIADGGRWLFDSDHNMRSAAVARAEEIIADGNVEGIRVVSESRRTGAEEIVLEENFDAVETPVKIVAIEDAPVCSKIEDFYTLPARLAAGRLLREYLDQKGQTALELAFDYGALRMLERNDVLFPSAMRRVGAIHAKKSGRKPNECNDDLYRFFEQIKNNARAAGDDEDRQNQIKQDGLAELIAHAPSVNGPQQNTVVLGALAVGLQKRGDWSDKLELVIELSKGASDQQVQDYLDPIAAEILDNSGAITEIFGGFPDAASALLALLQLTHGRCDIENPRSCISAFNDMVAKRPMPMTAQLLQTRVAKSLNGVRPITREDKTAECEAFKGILRELISSAGIDGGPRMASAVASRARIVFGEHEDLSVEEALGHVISLLPYRAIRLGYLLDLVCSPLGQSNEKVVLGVLARIVKQLTSLASLVPDDMPTAKVQAVMDDLAIKMESEKLPTQWRDLFTKTLDNLSVAAPDQSKPKTTMPEPAKPASDTQKQADDNVPPNKVKKPAKSANGIIRRTAQTGDVLFHEGDEGEEAYLIMDGEVEVFRQSGNDEVVLATLKRGDILGEMSLIDNQPRMASARVVGDTQLTVITRDDLDQRLTKLSESDKVLRRLIHVFVTRLRGQSQLMD